MARPKLDLDEEYIAELIMGGNHLCDIGALCGCDERTIRKRFAGLWIRKRAERRKKLRDLQMREAEKGNITMLIWLGKQELDQSNDGVKQTVTNMEKPVDKAEQQEQEAIKTQWGLVGPTVGMRNVG